MDLIMEGGIQLQLYGLPDNDRRSPHKSPFWVQNDFGSMRVFHRGVVTALSQFRSWGSCDEKDLLIQVTKWAQSQDSCFALVVESSNWIIGIVEMKKICLGGQRVSERCCFQDMSMGLIH